MANVSYNYRGETTDVLVDGVYVGAAVKTPAGYVTVHVNDTPSKTFQALHFATYYVEKH